jgi:hypothetical protein
MDYSGHYEVCQDCCLRTFCYVVVGNLYLDESPLDLFLHNIFCSLTFCDRGIYLTVPLEMKLQPVLKEPIVSHMV